MRPPRSLEELDDLVLRCSADDGNTDDGNTKLADRCEALAAKDSPDDAVSRSELLVAAAEQHQLAGNPVAAIALCRRAVADGGPIRLDARAHLAAALWRSGDADGARAVLDELWATRPNNPWALLFAGELLEEMGDTKAAITWFTRGVLRALHAGDDLHDELLLIARRRVRTTLGFPPDDYDLLAEEILLAYADELLAGEAEPPRPRGGCSCGSGTKAKRCCAGAPTYTAVTSVDRDQVVIDLVSH